MNKSVFVAIAPAVAIVLTGGCQPNKETEQAATEEKVVAFDIANIDSSYAPCENFYLFAAGNWINNNPVPSTESRWGSFNVLFEENNKKLKAILEEAMSNKDKKKGSVEQLVGDFYYAAMDSNKVEQLGFSPVQPELDEIDALTDKAALKDLITRNQLTGGQGIFGFYVGQDSKNSEVYIAYLTQSGLGMPDRDYYLNADEKSTETREAYREHVQKMFELIGSTADEAGAAAQTVLDVETKLAEISMTRTERRDVEKTYNKMKVEELSAMTSEMNWNEFFDKIEAKGVKEVVVRQPDFVKKADQLLASVPLESWKTYLKWHVIDQAAPYLHSAVVEQNFEFFGKTLRGTKELKPRWKRSMNAVNSYLGEPLGKLFVERHFPDSSKKEVANMVENLRAVYKERVRQLDWMSEETKEKALEKLDAFNYKIGYPDKWEDYSSVDISPENFYRNIKNTSKFAYMDMVEKLGQPVDKDEWFMTPQTVNAYYSSSHNEIVFPAGILQPPFYNKDADPAVNYGGIGGVIGHEFTHGFDDQGSKFDAAGNLNNWWTEEDRKRFEAKANVVVEQFNTYEPLDSMHINGHLTLGENLADLGGLTLAYHAMEKFYEGKEKPKNIDGFDHRQRFFLGWVNVWKNSITEEELRNRIITDPHSPGEYRVMGPLSNMKEFSEAFGCSPGDPMVRGDEERAVVW